MDWMGLEKIEKKFDLFGIQTHPIPLNPHGLRANRTRPYSDGYMCDILKVALITYFQQCKVSFIYTANPHTFILYQQNFFLRTTRFPVSTTTILNSHGTKSVRIVTEPIWLGTV
jgi:hypothetical protein